MGRTPYPALDRSDIPLAELSRRPEPRWKPARPGEISAPSEMPRDRGFGHPGPNIGWGWRLVQQAQFDRGSNPQGLEKVLAALVGRRASLAGRAPMRQDVEAVLIVAGLRPDEMNHEAVSHLSARRHSWLEAAAHEVSPGTAALAQVPAGLLEQNPDNIRVLLNREPSLVGSRLGADG